MIEYLDIHDFLESGKVLPMADTRSPSEYLQGHIPGAVSFPLFNDEERKEVGTLYKQKGRQNAIFRGFEIIGVKYSSLLDQGMKLAGDGKILLYCWRGGMRSGALAWLLSVHGIKVMVLKGGYKSYRRAMRSFFSRDLNLRILGGMTGSGKTSILREMKASGCQVIDLEAIAHHKGSAFGALGEEHQPTNEQFENDLFAEFQVIDPGNPTWVEDESPNIGRVFLPPELYARMKESRLVSIEIPRQTRLDRLVKDYSRFSKDDLMQCMQRIAKKIGGQNLNLASKMLEKSDYHAFADIALNYYDKTYRFSLQRRSESHITYLECDSGDPKLNAARIIALGI